MDLVTKSNLFTMLAASKVDKRNELPRGFYEMPDEASRLLRVKVMLEETLETINALGFNLYSISGDRLEKIKDFDYAPHQVLDMEEIIDGCCDMIYTAVGTLCKVGAPYEPHMKEVCLANNDKFPGGTCTVNNDGKFQKPAGWLPPDHEEIMQAYKTFGPRKTAEIITKLGNYDKAD